MKSNKQRILNVDDHDDSAEMVKLFFETRSCEVVIANKMAEGLALATSGRFDLYLLDTIFTDGSGIELARCIRAFDPQTPLVFVFGQSVPGGSSGSDATRSRRLHYIAVRPDGVVRVREEIYRGEVI